jgi:hypothetical protein
MCVDGTRKHLMYSSHKTLICTKGPPLHRSQADRNFELVLALDGANQGVVLSTGENDDESMHTVCICGAWSRGAGPATRS